MRILTLEHLEGTRSGEWWRGFRAGLFLSLVAVFLAVLGLLYMLTRL